MIQGINAKYDLRWYGVDVYGYIFLQGTNPRTYIDIRRK